MGYPDNVLGPDERLVLHRHPHWSRLVGPTIVLLSSTALAAFGAAVLAQTSWQPTARQIVAGAIALAWSLVVARLVVAPVLSWRATHFAITDRRVMFRRGVLNRQALDVPLARIDNVAVRQRLGDRLLGTGALIIESPAATPWEVGGIPRVQRVHALLYDELFDTRGSVGTAG